MGKLPGILKVATLCEELGEKLVTNPFLHIPRVRALLEQHVHSLEDLGPIVRHADYKRGQDRSQQPYRILNKEWLTTSAAAQEICTVNLLETDYVSITAFSLPAGTNLPLHDHPGMHVLCKVLSDGGPLQHWSYDWDLEGARRCYLEEGLSGMMQMDEGLYQHRREENALWQSAIHRLFREKELAEAASNGDIVPSAGDTLSNHSPQTNTSSPLPIPELLKAAIKKERGMGDVAPLIQQLRSAHFHGLRKSMLGRVEEVLPNAVLVSSGNIGPSNDPLDPPGGVKWIRPTQGGVLHRFSATSTAPTCFIDVITPPYYRDGTGNIPCTYFSTSRPKGSNGESPSTPIKVGDKASLRPLPGPPGNLFMDGHTAGYLIA